MICTFILRRCHRRLNRQWFYGEARNRTCDPGLQAVAVVLGFTSTGRVGSLSRNSRRSSTDSGSGFNASQKGQRLKVSFDRKKQQLLVAFPWVEPVLGREGFMICVFII